jgi:hypothetical protein
MALMFVADPGVPTLAEELFHFAGKEEKLFR